MEYFFELMEDLNLNWFIVFCINCKASRKKAESSVSNSVLGKTRVCCCKPTGNFDRKAIDQNIRLERKYFLIVWLIIYREIQFYFE